MTTTAGIWNSTNSQSTNPLAASPQATSSQAASPMDSSGSSSSTGSSTISANDFLTLLVTEMQNQDPTSATDPNQYINQLVSVNSLEQLIQINQTLGLALTGGNSTPPSSAPVSGAGLDSHLSGSASSVGAGNLPTSFPHAVPTTSGNLGIPAANPAAERVAQALSPRAHLN